MDTDYRQRWIQYWMRRAGRDYKGRIATWMASLFAPPYKDARFLSIMNPVGYISPHSTIGRKGVEFGKNVFIDDRVTIYRAQNGGPIVLGDRVAVLRDSIIETEFGGTVKIGNGTWIHQKCNLSAAASDIIIGRRCHDRSRLFVLSSQPLRGTRYPVAKQPLYSDGPIIVRRRCVDRNRVIVLSGVQIGDRGCNRSGLRSHQEHTGQCDCSWRACTRNQNALGRLPVMTHNAKKLCAIAVPLSMRNSLTEDELTSFRHLERHLNRYDRYLVALNLRK